MVSSGSASEIVEYGDELSIGNYSNRPKPIRIKLREGEGKLHSHPIEDDLSCLIETIDLSPSCQMVSDMQKKDAHKRLLRGGASQESCYGISESVTLKQALRRLCISQASEQAAMKRSAKPIGFSNASEAGTIKRLFASVIVEGSKSDLIDIEVKKKLLEVSMPPAALKPCHKKSQLCDACNAELPSKKVVSRTQNVIASPSTNATKTRIQDVISAAPPAKGRGPSTIVSELGIKRKSNPKVLKSCPETETKATLRNNSSFAKKGRSESNSSSSGNLSKLNSGVLRKPGEAIGTKSKDHASNECACNSNSARMNKTQRSREKKECSQSSMSSLGDYSSSTSISGESNQSSFCGNNAIRPHMSKDIKWVAIRHTLSHLGGLGLMNFKLIRKLGCGDIGTVYLAELTGSGCLFALKVMDVEFLLSRKKILRAQSEREILQMLDHPFLPTLYAHFTTDNLSCLVMEYCPGGDLHVLRQRQPGRRFSEPAARFYVAEVLLALEYLHMLGVIYRDLKPENILVREDGHIMLSDFDLSLRCTVSPTLVRSSSAGREEGPAGLKRIPGPCADSSCMNPNCLHPSLPPVSCFTPRLLSSGASAKTQVSPLPQLVVEPTDARSNSFVGTHEYLAPEIIKGDGHGSAVDWWTYGIFLYELMYGRTPFKGAGNDETLANVVSQSLKFPETPTVSPRALDLIKRLLVKEPETRFGCVRGAAEIKGHPFFEGLNWALIRCASPPEVPGGSNPGTPLLPGKKKEGGCLDFGTNGDVQIELF